MAHWVFAFSALIQFSQFFFSHFQLFRPEYHWRDLSSRNAHLVHQNWYRINFTFVCLFLFIAARAIFQLSGGCHHYRWQGCIFWPLLGPQGLWARRNFYRAPPTATWDLGLYSLIRKKTCIHVPQWDSNPRRKDQQIIAPDALTAAPRWRLLRNLAIPFITLSVRQTIVLTTLKNGNWRWTLFQACHQKQLILTPP
jgi:hypothetical protein